jgi:hypothetical protein
MTSTFGQTLRNAVSAGATLPDFVDLTLQVLSFCVPSDESLFALDPRTDAEIADLKARFDEWPGASSGQLSPVAAVSNPQVLAGALRLYFEMLPHPVVPPK